VVCEEAGVDLARTVAVAGIRPLQLWTSGMIVAGGCLCWHEPHVGAGDRLANRLCVSHVVLRGLLFENYRHTRGTCPPREASDALGLPAVAVAVLPLIQPKYGL
jgi:hypothetical protein